MQTDNEIPRKVLRMCDTCGEEYQADVHDKTCICDDCTQKTLDFQGNVVYTDFYELREVFDGVNTIKLEY